MYSAPNLEKLHKNEILDNFEIGYKITKNQVLSILKISLFIWWKVLTVLKYVTGNNMGLWNKLKSSSKCLHAGLLLTILLWLQSVTRYFTWKGWQDLLKSQTWRNGGKSFLFSKVQKMRKNENFDSSLTWKYFVKTVESVI